MSDQQFDPLQIAAQLGGTTDPTVEEVANSEVFAEPAPTSPVTEASPVSDAKAEAEEDPL